jgi:hypothetical protein
MNVCRINEKSSLRQKLDYRSPSWGGAELMMSKLWETVAALRPSPQFALALLNYQPRSWPHLQITIISMNIFGARRGDLFRLPFVVGKMAGRTLRNNQTLRSGLLEPTA